MPPCLVGACYCHRRLLFFLDLLFVATLFLTTLILFFFFCSVVLLVVVIGSTRNDLAEPPLANKPFITSYFVCQSSVRSVCPPCRTSSNPPRSKHPARATSPSRTPFFAPTTNYRISCPSALEPRLRVASLDPDFPLCDRARGQPTLFSVYSILHACQAHGSPSLPTLLPRLPLVRHLRLTSSPECEITTKRYDYNFSALQRHAVACISDHPDSTDAPSYLRCQHSLPRRKRHEYHTHTDNGRQGLWQY